MIISLSVNLHPGWPLFSAPSAWPQPGFSGSSYKQAKRVVEISSAPTENNHDNTLKQNNKLLPVQNCSQTTRHSADTKHKAMGRTGEVVQHTALQISFPSGHCITPALRGPSNQYNFDSNITTVLSKILKQLEITVKSNRGGEGGWDICRTKIQKLIHSWYLWKCERQMCKAQENLPGEKM